MFVDLLHPYLNLNLAVKFIIEMKYFSKFRSEGDPFSYCVRRIPIPEWAETFCGCTEKNKMSVRLNNKLRKTNPIWMG